MPKPILQINCMYNLFGKIKKNHLSGDRDFLQKDFNLILIL